MRLMNKKEALERNRREVAMRGQNLFNNFKGLAVIMMTIGWIAATAKCVSIPCDPSATTQKSYNEKYLNWLRRVTLDAYAQTTLEPDMELIRFLDNALQVETRKCDAPPLQSVIDLGVKLLQTGNNSPYFLNWYGIMLVTAGQNTEAIPLLKASLAWFESTENMKIQAFFASGYLAQALYSADRIIRGQREEIGSRHVEYLIHAVATGAFPGDDIQIAYRLISERFEKPFTKHRWNHYYEKMNDKDTIDSWFKFMIEGRVEHRKGWDARGRSNSRCQM
jgi:hypothetical protein